MSIDTDAAKRLRQGIEMIEEYGWIQKRYGSCATGFCATGAIGHEAWMHFRNYRKVVSRAMAALSVHLNEVPADRYTRWSATRDPLRVIPLWNDDPRTTQNMVVTAMRTVADMLDNGMVKS